MSFYVLRRDWKGLSKVTMFLGQDSGSATDFRHPQCAVTCSTCSHVREERDDINITS
jgi:hypothetical protein